MNEQAQQNNEKVHPNEPPRARKKGWDIRYFINSPYLFIALPILLGGYILAKHPEYMLIAANYPWAWAFVLAVPVALFAAKVIINFFSVIEQWIRVQFDKARKAKRSQFLEFVIAVFMFVSVSEGGPFFNKVQGNVLGGALGYVTVFAFDLVAVVCMRARAKMLRRGHDKKATVYQLGVYICAIVSAYANLYSALINLQDILAHPSLMTLAAPLAGVAFPGMIIFLSHATSADEDDAEDPEAFRKEQEKLRDFLKAKRETMEQQLEERVKLDLLKRQEFVLKSIFFTKAKVAQVIDAVFARVLAEINKEIKSLKEEIARREQTISKQAEEITQKTQTISDLVQNLQSLETRYKQEHQSAMAKIRSQFDELRDEIAKQKTALSEQITTQLNAQKTSDLTKLAAQVALRLPSPEHQIKASLQGVESRIQFRLTQEMNSVHRQLAELAQARKAEMLADKNANSFPAEHGNDIDQIEEIEREKSENFSGNPDPLLAEIEREKSENFSGNPPGNFRELSTDPRIAAVRKSTRKSRGRKPEMPEVIDLAKRRAPLTIAETAIVINKTERYVQMLVKKNEKLKRADEQGKLVTAASVRSFLAAQEEKEVKVS